MNRFLSIFIPAGMIFTLFMMVVKLETAPEIPWWFVFIFPISVFCILVAAFLYAEAIGAYRRWKYHGSVRTKR